MYTLKQVREEALKHLADMGYSGDNLEDVQIDCAMSDLIRLLEEDGEAILFT